MKLLVRIALLLCLAALPLGAQSLDEQYVKIYNLIQQGDYLRDGKQPEPALEKFREAEELLKKLQTSYPQWNENVVKFRIRYIADRISTLEAVVATLPKRDVPAAVPVNPVVPAASLQPPPPGAKDTDLRQFIETLQTDMRRLEGDKSTLEAKLREALSAQPATMDPRKLSAAEEQIRMLQKENEILKVSVRQERDKNRDVVSRAEHEKLKTALTEATSKLAEQAEIIARLRLEKEALQARIQKMIEDSKENVLKAENEKLKLQVAELAAKAAKTDELNAQIQNAKQALEDSLKQMDKLAKDKADLERNLKQMSATVPTEPASAPIKLANPAATDENKILAARVRSLEGDLAEAKKLVIEAGNTVDRLVKDRNTLLVKVSDLEVAQKNPASPAADPKSSGDQMGRERMTNQLAILRSRLDVLEARQIPYTAEEKALFEKPVIAKQSSEAGATKKPSRVLPVGAATLVAQAERAFNERRLDEAESLYKQVLKLDEKNIYTLANIAAVQSELGRLEDAEASLKRSLAESSEDPYSLTLLGIVRFRQGRYDDALDVLSKAAQVEPNNAEIQNYLGITLSQKGLRGPAETALRKAVQLAPGYGSAHHNLAVTYAMAQPPSLELARWHYQKALDAKHPRNAELEKVIGGGKDQQAQPVQPAPAAKPN